MIMLSPPRRACRRTQVRTLATCTPFPWGRMNVGLCNAGTIWWHWVRSHVWFNPQPWKAQHELPALWTTPLTVTTTCTLPAGCEMQR